MGGGWNLTGMYMTFKEFLEWQNVSNISSIIIFAHSLPLDSICGIIFSEVCLDLINKDFKQMLRKAVFSETNSQSVLWHMPDVFTCIHYQEIKMKLNTYQNLINDISAVFINHSERSEKPFKVMRHQSLVLKLLWGKKQVLKFQIYIF